jgi:hypothetical protein
MKEPITVTEHIGTAAFEPATQLAVPREEWRQRGELRFLKHGESVSYRLEITPLVGAEATGLL